jgi:hypothetical protein
MYTYDSWIVILVVIILHQRSTKTIPSQSPESSRGTASLSTAVLGLPARCYTCAAKHLTLWMDGKKKDGTHGFNHGDVRGILYI